MLKKVFLSLALSPALLGFGGAALADALPMPAGYPTLLGASCGGDDDLCHPAAGNGAMRRLDPNKYRPAIGARRAAST